MVPGSAPRAFAFVLEAFDLAVTVKSFALP
jgi:hypothetical protein